MSLAPGTRLDSYEILGPIGAGGMGEVYRARHLKLGRDVAIKVLPTDVAADRVRLARFEREARTASALNDRNIVTIHDISDHGGMTWIAMELVEGRTLAELIADGPLPVDRILDIATQVAEGIAAAHAAGIVHRDIKPANVMVTADGLVKILDFGLAKPLSLPEGASLVAPELTATREGEIVGTPHYMSPEQLTGADVDHRSDQFAIGVVLYEMAAGKPPFDGASLGAVLGAILARAPQPLGDLRPDVPSDLQRIVHRCVEKDPAKRFPSSTDLRAALARCARRRARAAFVRRPVVAGPIAATLLALLAAGTVWVRGADRRWAENHARDEIGALIEDGALFEAYRTGLRAQRHLGNDPELQRLVERISFATSVNTEPQGAEVFVKGYDTPEADWHRVGVTPLSMRVPYAGMRWRITKEGYEPYEAAPFSAASMGQLRQGLVLDPTGSLPEGTVRIPGGPVAGSSSMVNKLEQTGAPPVVRTFFLDRHEVTKREYLEFVEAGGYGDPASWPSPLERSGAVVSWGQAMRGLVDVTGRPGPAGWELGRYPEGEDDYPVGGISWFEAAAYCAWRGRSLPTIYHWSLAVGQHQLSALLVMSNTSGDGPAPVGSFDGLAGFGNEDMAGNVREWVWNASGELRYLLGGAWNEAGYVFLHPFAVDPWQRGPTNGVRCAVYPEPPAERLLAPVAPRREYPLPEPMDEQAFELVRGMYAYDRGSLDARVERVNDTLPGWRRETVSMRTAYGEERMEVHLHIPRDVEPPYQSVIWFPGGDVYGLRSSDQLSSAFLVDFLPRAGRVLVQPVYYGMYERFEQLRWDSPAYLRDVVIRWAQDLGRVIDYLETRPDFDSERIGFYGFSNGASFAPIFTAIEPRIATAILLGAGLLPVPFRPEAHPATFAPRSRTPTLMVNGHDDFMLPYDLSQRALLDMLGAPDSAKRLARLEGGHIPSDRRDVMREVLDWLDQQLGPVVRRTASPTD
ncbi:MAG TPA: protein kinase [Longimicrobiales bacterium]|nr:protein kinase [Longimicrobiales bacterium]